MPICCSASSFQQASGYTCPRLWCHLPQCTNSQQWCVLHFIIAWMQGVNGRADNKLISFKWRQPKCTWKTCDLDWSLIASVSQKGWGTASDKKLFNFISKTRWKRKSLRETSFFCGPGVEGVKNQLETEVGDKQEGNYRKFSWRCYIFFLPTFRFDEKMEPFGLAAFQKKCYKLTSSWHTLKCICCIIHKAACSSK